MKATTGWIRIISLGALLLAASPAMAAGEMYRWVDANGQVHYSDQPPPADAKDIKSMRSKGIEPIESDDSDDSAEPSYVEQNAAFEERQAKKAEDQAKAAEEKRAEDERKKNCQLARSNYNTVSVGGRITRVNAQGEREYLSDEEIESETAEARRAMEQWCNED